MTRRGILEDTFDYRGAQKFIVAIPKAMLAVSVLELA